MKKKTNKKEEKCNHDLKDKETTLKKINRKNMIFPPIDVYMCGTCHEFFEIDK